MLPIPINDVLSSSSLLHSNGMLAPIHSGDLFIVTKREMIIIKPFRLDECLCFRVHKMLLESSSSFMSSEHQTGTRGGEWGGGGRGGGGEGGGRGGGGRAGGGGTNMVDPRMD